MTLPVLHYIISDTEPADVDSGTTLSNTAVMSILPIKYSSIIKEQTSITGLTYLNVPFSRSLRIFHISFPISNILSPIYGK